MSNKHSPLPAVRSVLLADQILVEAGTGKKTLVGIYTNLNLRRLPARRQLNVYVELSDACGDYDFDLKLSHLGSGAVVAQGRLRDIVSSDKLSSLEIIIKVPVLFREFGAYEFSMSHEGTVFASRVVRVMPADENTFAATEPLSPDADN